MVYVVNRFIKNCNKEFLELLQMSYGSAGATATFVVVYSKRKACRFGMLGVYMLNLII